MTAEFPPEIAVEPPRTPPWWRTPAVLAVMMGVSVMNFALTTDHRPAAEWLLLAALAVGFGAIAWQVWAHHRSRGV